MSGSKIIGIDLGTTNSCVAVMHNGSPHIIENSEGFRVTPSVVYFGNKTVVGKEAQKNMLIEPLRTIYGSKRLIGRKIYDKEIKEYIKTLPFLVVGNCKDDVRISIDGRKISPEEVGSKILERLKKTAEDFLGDKVKRSVITVPAYFNDSQRQSTKDAGRLAGMEVLRVLNEPTAAALAYGLDRKKNGTIAVYDLGGGTFDVSILELHDGVFEVKSTSGNTHLGGEDLDAVLLKFMMDKVEKEYKISLEKDTAAIVRLKKIAEESKISLSQNLKTKVYEPFLTFKDGKPIHLDIEITRDEFETLARPIIEKTIKPCTRALSDANISIDKIDHVLLVGGMTRMPLVQEVVTKFFNKPPTLGINPDEAIAKGAAIQAGILSQDVQDVLLLDVSSLSLGIETIGGIFNKIIPRNTTLPTKQSQMFTTSEDNQTSVDINIFQGERPLVKDNKKLGCIRLQEIPPSPKGVPRIEVTFEADANGIYTVTARDKATGKQQAVEIIPSTGITKEEIEKIIQESENNEDKDQEELKKIEEHLQIL